jgi:hypothetical protein
MGPEDPGHMTINFYDKPFGITSCGRNIIVDGPKTEKAGFVHGRDGGDCNVDFHEIPN